MAEISGEQIVGLTKAFYSDPKNLLAQNAVTSHDPLDFCIHHGAAGQNLHVYTHKVAEAKPMSNQRSSGRCWMFACLNAMRIPFMRKLNIEEFEFSQNHLFFWDKIERSNYFLTSMVEIFKKGEPVEGRLVSFMLTNPVNDGGQWDMLVNLVNKYGVMPKKCFPEAHSSGASRRLNIILTTKLRDYAKALRDMVEKKASDADIEAKIKEQLSEVFRVTSICLGIPPTTFTWEYYDKTKTYQTVGPITPKDFYLEHVKPVFNMDDKVCIVNDPRPKKYDDMYTVEYLGNMVGGQKTLYNNQPIDVLKSTTLKSIQNGEPVWFGCDVGKFSTRKTGMLDIKSVDYELVFGIQSLQLDKAERLLYGESLMTHAMVFTGVGTDGAETETKTTKWRVENSWGEDVGEKGYLVMADDWFSEFVYEVVVDKSYVPAEVLAVQTKEPVVLPPWDPMGSLAHAGSSKL